MKNHNPFRLPVLFAVTAVVASLLPLRADDTDVEIFTGKNQVRPAWMASGWGGLTVETSNTGGRTPGSAYVTTKIDDKTAPYAGLSLHTAYGVDAQTAAIPLTPEQSASGFVELYLNCGKPLGSNESGGAKYKIVLLFVMKDGKTVTASLDNLPPLDSDRETWEAVQVPLAPLLAKVPEASSIVGLAGVNVQYLDAPTCEIRVTDCSLKTK